MSRNQLETLERKPATASPMLDKVNANIDYLSSIFGGKIVDDETRGVLQVRIAHYMRTMGAKLVDVETAGRWLAVPQRSARIKFREDLLAEFASVMSIVIRNRKEAEENARRDAEIADNRAWMETAEGKKLMEEFRRRAGSLGTPIGSGRESSRTPTRGVTRGNEEASRRFRQEEADREREREARKEAARQEAGDGQHDGDHQPAEQGHQEEAAGQTRRGAVKPKRRQAAG